MGTLLIVVLVWPASDLCLARRSLYRTGTIAAAPQRRHALGMANTSQRYS